MLRLDKVIKPWKESASLNDHINLYGFWNETAFLTKSGDLGMVLSVPGVDYESLDRSEQEYAVKRLEAALKAFGPGFHAYQYLFKSNQNRDNRTHKSRSEGSRRRRPGAFFWKTVSW
jgi:type IV secretion system protein VirB4